MFEEIIPTYHAPSIRFNKLKIVQQSELISNNKLIIQLFDSINQMVVILNQYRQIIYTNKSYQKFCNTNDAITLLGKRPGESFGCINAYREMGGCGTSEFCKTCGAVNSILNAQAGIKSTKECKIRTSGNEAYEFQVTATPFNLDGEKLTIFSLLDISAEKRKESIERIFLHDILNSAGGISSLSGILKEMRDPDEMAEVAQIIETAAGNLIDEIKMQRELSSAEQAKLKPEFTSVWSLQILNNLVNINTSYKLNQSKKVCIHNQSVDVILKTDVVLLKRVLGNMIKNAIEANIANDVITLKSTEDYRAVRFEVHNKSFIPRNIQIQLFHRSFSTKGSGRGLGTYSMKLLGEKYLKGNVWAKSTKETGTSFFLEVPKQN